MNLENIRPFLRFVRHLEYDSTSLLPENKPYDARFFYTTIGSGTIMADNAEYRMEKGSLLFIPAGISYRLCTPENIVHYLAVNFDFSEISKHRFVPIPPCIPEEFSKDGMTEHIFFEDSDLFNNVLYLKNMLSLRPALDEIVREFSLKPVMYERKISSLFTEILIKCVRTALSPKGTYETNPTERIIQYIHENFTVDLTNLKIAEEFGFHPNYISTLVKEYTGLPLHKYLISIRLELALKLLEEGNLLVGEIAERCGFCDIYHFSKYFKSVFGKSPTAYIKR